MSALRVEFFEQGRQWFFAVPALSILGGGDPTREDAEAHCLDAISFALEQTGEDDGGVVVTYDVEVKPHAAA